MSTSATPGKSAYTLLYTLGTVSLIFIAAVGIFCWHKGAQLQERANHNSSGR